MKKYISSMRLSMLLGLAIASFSAIADDACPTCPSACYVSGYFSINSDGTVSGQIGNNYIATKLDTTVGRTRVAIKFAVPFGRIVASTAFGTGVAAVTVENVSPTGVIVEGDNSSSVSFIAMPVTC